MKMTRVRMTVTMDMDMVPGAFHTTDSCVEILQYMLDNAIPHYHPSVQLADCPVVDDEVAGVLADLSRMPDDSEVWEQA